MEEVVICTSAGGIATLSLNRPDKLNALNAESFRQLSGHLDSLEGQSISCLLLKGIGRSFCAGHDLDDLATGTEAGHVERFESGVVERLATLPYPVIAAVQGHCYTGGLELALAADLIVAADDARFADTHAKWDLVPIWGLTQRLPRRVGRAKAQEMMFTSRSYSGEEALDMGLVNLCVPAGRLVGEATRLCEEIARNSARSIRAIKTLLTDTDGLSLRAGLAWELHHSEGHGPDYVSMIEKRKNA